jgi:hypothetical protein
MVLKKGCEGLISRTFCEDIARAISSEVDLAAQPLSTWKVVPPFHP